MEKNNRPQGHSKKVAGGSANFRKGERTDAGGVGNGGRGGADGSQRQAAPRQATRRGGSQRSAGSALGLLSVFLALPKKLRRIVLLVVVAAAGFFLLRGALSGGQPIFDGESGWQQSEPAQESGELAAVTASPIPSLPAALGSSAPGAAAAAREKRVTPLGGGQDTVTVMIYLCGTDLESKYGMGTSDLSEMTKADIAGNVNVIAMTGGCKRWRNTIVSSSVNEIYKVESGGLQRLEANFGSASMTGGANLTRFIDYCEENYSADRNFLILWDHGGGTVTGYGYDEKSGSSDSMTLAEIDKALADAGCTFDWIGFDACLMATLETALVCSDYADYLIASEETEPGTGWYYTGWLNALSQNTSLPTEALAKTLIDDFVAASCQDSARAQVTLSVIDLAKLEGVAPDFRAFSVSTAALLESEEYRQVSDARAGVRQFAQSSRINQVDLIDLAQRIDTDASRALAQSLTACIPYNKSTISRAYGVSIYFPYETLSDMNGAVSAYEALGMDEEYTRCIKSFASLEQGGQLAASAAYAPSGSGDFGSLLGTLLESYTGSGGASSPLGSLLGSCYNSAGSPSAGSSLGVSDVMGLLSAFAGRNAPTGLSWLDTDAVARSAGHIAENFLDPGRLTVSWKNQQRVLTLTEEEWSLIASAELNVYLNDGHGFVDLGLDNILNWNDDGDLVLDYDRTWLTVNGCAAAYYTEYCDEAADGTLVTVGRIPMLLNGEAMNLRVVFRGDDAAVTGAYPLYQKGETDTESKGNLAIEPGDELVFLCDYYGYTGSFDASYTLGEALTVGEEGLALAYMDIGSQPCSVTYRLTDIYGNQYWTPAFTA